MAVYFECLFPETAWELSPLGNAGSSPARPGPAGPGRPAGPGWLLTKSLWERMC